MKSTCIILLIFLLCLVNMQAGAEEVVPSLRIEPVEVGEKRLPEGLSYTAVQTYDRAQVDGNLEEWGGVEPIVLGDKTRRTRIIVGGVDPWRGSEDLSARAYLMWDVDYLYFACDVTDDVLHQPSDVSGNLWSGDAIQMAFDTLNDDTKGALGSDDYDLTIGLTQKGPGVWRSWGPQGKRRGVVETIDVAVQKKPDDKGYFYEAAIPWGELYPLIPVARGMCGFTFVVADNDGKGFKGGLEWTMGIWYGKDPAAFGDLILQSVSPQEGMQIFVFTGQSQATDDDEEVVAYVGINSAAVGQTSIAARVELGEEVVSDLGQAVQVERGANRFRAMWNPGRAAIGRYNFVVGAGEVRSSVIVLKYSSSSLESEIAAIERGLKAVPGEEAVVADVTVRLEQARKRLREGTLALLGKVYGILDEAQNTMIALEEERKP